MIKILLLIFLIASVSSKSTIWLDCDPGIDDTFAIILAAVHPNINLLGVSTVGGNTQLSTTTQNANNILAAIGRTDISVYEGTQKLVSNKKLEMATQIHGTTGIGGAVFPHSNKKIIKTDSFRKIADKIMESKEKVSVILVGPDTNWCYLLKEYPEIKTNIKQINIMGGAIGEGNASPASEFNIYADPEATDCVLREKGNIPFTMIPLDVTNKVLAQEDMFDFLKRHAGNLIADNLLKMLQFYQSKDKEYNELQYPAFHDPTAVYFTLHPQQYITEEAKIVVDLGKTSYGRTNCYLIDKYRSVVPNAKVARQLPNQTNFWETMQKSIQIVLRRTNKKHLTSRSFEE